MYPKKVAKDTAKVVQSYLTYQAVQTIIDQLSETDPQSAIWLRNYSSKTKIQDSEEYIEGLMLENKELVMRIMTVRQHLANEVLEYIPVMVSTGIEQANLEHRRHLLERLTQSQPASNFPSNDTDRDHSSE